jgi:hypothetical protein
MLEDRLSSTSVPPMPLHSVQGPEGAGAAIWSQFLLRIASSAGALVIGSYFVALQAHGVPITSLLIGALTGLGYLTEFLFAPFAGALSDARGRRVFLLAGSLLAAGAVLLLPLGSLQSWLPPPGLVLLLVGSSRLLEGAGAAAFVPATLGLLVERTDHDPLRRGRQMSWYELASSGGESRWERSSGHCSGSHSRYGHSSWWQPCMGSEVCWSSSSFTRRGAKRAARPITSSTGGALPRS